MNSFRNVSILAFANAVKWPSIYESFDLSQLEEGKKDAILYETSFFAQLPIRALYGENPVPDEQTLNFHEWCRTTPAGHCLNLQAIFARRQPQLWPRFGLSLRKPGSFLALLALAKSLKLDVPISNAHSISELGEIDQADKTAVLYAEVIRDEIPLPGTADFVHWLNELSRLKNNAARRKARARDPKQGIYKTILKTQLLAADLWTRTSSEIASEYFPEAGVDEYEDRVSGINKAFYLMGLSHIRRTDIP